MLSRVILGALLMASGIPSAPDKVLTARVSPMGGVGPADIVIQAFIEPNAENRSVSFIVDSDSFYASSVSALEGERAARIKEMRFRMLPKGSYQVQVVLLGTKGERSRFASSVLLW